MVSLVSAMALKRTEFSGKKKNRDVSGRAFAWSRSSPPDE